MLIFIKTLKKIRLIYFQIFLIKNSLTQVISNECLITKKLALEYEAFGFYLSDHPSKIYKNINTIKNITDLGLLNDSDLDQIGAKSNFTCICLSL